MSETNWRRRLSIGLAAMTVGGIGAGGARGGGYSFVRIADERDGAFSFDPARQPVINNAGSVGFYANSATAFEHGYYLGSGGAASTIVTDAHPTLSGWGLHSPSMNDSGQIAFYADNIGADTPFRIYRAAGGGSLSLIAAAGSGTFGGLDVLPSINNSGNVAFTVGTGGLAGQYIGNGASVTPVYVLGDGHGVSPGFSNPSLNNHGSISFNGHYSFAVGGAGAHLKGGPGAEPTVIADGRNDMSSYAESVINDGGMVVFGGTRFSAPTRGIFYGSGDGSITTFVDTDGAFSDVAYVHGIGAGGFPALNNGGTIAFKGILRTGGSGIFTNPDPELGRVIGTGSSIFGRSVNDLPGGLSREGINDAGELTFVAQLLDDRGFSMAVVKAIPTVHQEWNVDGNGDWSVSGNWIGPVPDAYHHSANFLGAITAPRTVTLGSPVTVGTIHFDNAHSYTIAGTRTITLNDSFQGNVIVGAGSHTIDAPFAFGALNTGIVMAPATNLTITNPQPADLYVANFDGAGAILRMGNYRFKQLNVNAGTCAVIPNGTSSGASHIGTLNLGSGAAFDLNDNDLVVTHSSVGSISAAIASARHGGAWDLPGITSSATRTQPSHATTLGVLSGAEYTSASGSTSFNGFSIADTDVLVKYTWYGDTDFNGKVNFDDYVRTDNGFNNHLSGWINGDFDLNGAVNFDDYVLIDLAFNTQTGTLGRALAFLDGSDRSTAGMSSPSLQRVAAHFAMFGDAYGQRLIAAVPEPVTMPLLAFGAVVTGARRRRR